MNTVGWNLYRLVIETVATEDGGGFRIYYPTLGFAVYGSGDSLDESINSLKESQKCLEKFMVDTPDYKLPEPTHEDRKLFDLGCELTDSPLAYAA